MSLWLLSLVLALQLTSLYAEDHVLALTQDDFKSTIAQYEFVLVKFYAPWCGHCKKLEPEFIKAAEMLKNHNSPVKLAKVDATVHKDLATEFEVRGYPTLKFFINQSAMDYNGGRDAESIVNWCLKKMGPSVTPLESVADAKKLIGEQKFVVFGFFKDSDADSAKQFEKVAGSMDDIVFASAMKQEILDEYKITKTPHVVVFRNFDDPRVDFEDSFDKLADFVRIEQVPLIADFSAESASVVFGSPVRKHVVAFLSDSNKQERENLVKAAKNANKKVHFLIIDVNNEDHGRIVDFFNLKKEDAPTYRGINLQEEMAKFKPDSSDMSVDALTQFVQKFINNELEPYLASQDIPAENDGPVMVLVGKNYNEVTNDKSKHVFVKLYAPWCGHCKNLAPTWEDLGKAFQSRDDVIIAKMDATANEAKGLRIESYPTLLFYPKNSEEPINYSGERTLEALKSFVESDGKTMKPPKQDGDDDEEEEPSRDEL